MFGWTQLIGRRRPAPVLRGAARVPDGRRVYVVGDIHGRADLLTELHAVIREDAADNDLLARVVVYLGDYVDRGLHSFEVLETLIHEPLDGFRRVHLMGNHEDMMLKFLDDPRDGHWMMNGGDATLWSYGIRIDSMMMMSGDLRQLADRLDAAVPAEHRRFLEGLDVSHAEGDYFFVHAGVRPGVRLDAQKPADMMWIRHAFIEAEEGFEKRIVHGHTIAPEPEVTEHRIGIDTGAFSSGRLTCLVLEGDGHRFLQT